MIPVSSAVTIRFTLSREYFERYSRNETCGNGKKSVQEFLLRRRRSQNVDGRRCGDRINNVRTDQAIATNAGTIAVGCPFCLTMISDGIKDKQQSEKMVALDISEIVVKAMGIEEVKAPVDTCAT